jgi:LysR family glycine cleavage system transcriptional activator
MKELPLNSLRALAAVWEHAGVRTAARALGVAHSSISRHLAQLESWVGLALTRPSAGRRGLTFTRHGEELARATVGGLREIERAVATLREARSEQTVHLGTVASFAARWLLPRLPAFETSQPHVELSVLVEKRLDHLERAGLDLAIRMGRGPFTGGRGEPLLDDLLYPVMSPDFWERHGRPTGPEQLVGLRLLHDRDPDASWESWRAAHGPPSLEVSKGPRFTSTDLVLRAAVQGQGVALGRHQLARDDLEAGLLLRPFGAASVRLDDAYWLVLPSSLLPSAATATVVAWLRREAARAGTGLAATGG